MGHYFTNDDNLKSNENIIDVMIKNNKYSFITDNGVFSKKGLDFGTRSLLEVLNIDKIKGRVLDFGCGYGPIGIYVRKNTNAVVDMIDINKRSLELARKNAKLNNVDVNIFESDTYQNINNKYDFIITNPPIRIGKDKLYEILFNAKRYLNKDGELWLVINKNQGAKSLFQDLREVYDVKIVEKNKGFFIILAKIIDILQ
jgi:16S rRNA (guanine1207-N2)-methyltransferase